MNRINDLIEKIPEPVLIIISVACMFVGFWIFASIGMTFGGY